MNKQANSVFNQLLIKSLRDSLDAEEKENAELRDSVKNVAYALEDITKERDALMAKLDGGIRCFYVEDGLASMAYCQHSKPNATLIIDEGVNLDA